VAPLIAYGLLLAGVLFIFWGIMQDDEDPYDE